MMYDWTEIATGTVHGAAARKYIEYTYFKPDRVPLDIFQLDPDRLLAAYEYPRRVTRPSLPEFPMTALADYRVSVGRKDSSGTHLVRVTLEPNEHTAARTPKPVFEERVSSYVFRRLAYSQSSFVDELLHQAFRVK
jgi:hypothetical protein